jgi:photosystem II stability/assembly factor-like uncharacterized protein
MNRRVRVPHTSQPHRDVWAFVRARTAFLTSASALRSGLRHTLDSRMRSFHLLLALTLATTQAASFAFAQWDIEESHTTASLRGIHNVGGGVAWTSGTNGTVLRTEDGGYLWQTCSIPPGAEKLDFRGVQAFDENTAIVMSSGPGDQSRLYKTTDGCQTWKLLFTNPDKEGFWDTYRLDQRRHLGILLGDPVSNHFAIWQIDRDDSAFQIKRFHHSPRVQNGESAFAASNSALFVDDVFFDFWIATGGKNGAHVIKRIDHDFDSFGFDTFPSVAVPIGNKTESSGIFSLCFRKEPDAAVARPFLVGVAVGGDYLKPEDLTKTAAITDDGGKSWYASTTPPHGYRSSVAYDATQKLWITVGPNGTDISTDDGKNWLPLTPSSTDPADTDKSWNALSLPFVVGPHGRIGRLRTIDQKTAVTKKP